MTTESEIERSAIVLERSVFASIFALTRGQKWLELKSEEIFETLSLCATPEETELVVDLLGRFHFTNASEHLKKLEKLSKHIAGSWNCDPQKTIIVALERGNCADSSSRIVQDLKAPFAYLDGWKTPNFISRLGDAVELSSDDTTIVVVDDFAGTGGSINKKVTWLRDRLQEVDKSPTIRVAVVSAMMQSKDLLEAVVDDFFALEWLPRGISDHYDGAPLATAVTAMERLETELAKRIGNKKLTDYHFGWQRSEAIFYTEGANPPNNNFPIFWWPLLKGKKERNPILRRI